MGLGVPLLLIFSEPSLANEKSPFLLLVFIIYLLHGNGKLFAPFGN